MSLTTVLYYCDLLFGLYPSSLCFLTTIEASLIDQIQQSRFHLMTREELSLETLWLKNIRTMDEVQITDRSNRILVSPTLSDISKALYCNAYTPLFSAEKQTTYSICYHTDLYVHFNLRLSYFSTTRQMICTHLNFPLLAIISSVFYNFVKPTHWIHSIGYYILHNRLFPFMEHLEHIYYLPKLIVYHMFVYRDSLTVFIFILARPSVKSLTLFYWMSSIILDYLHFTLSSSKVAYQLNLPSFTS
jgi:hypothetical protein